MGVSSALNDNMSTADSCDGLQSDDLSQAFFSISETVGAGFVLLGL